MLVNRDDFDSPDEGVSREREREREREGGGGSEIADMVECSDPKKLLHKWLRREEDIAQRCEDGCPQSVHRSRSVFCQACAGRRVSCMPSPTTATSASANPFPGPHLESRKRPRTRT